MDLNNKSDFLSDDGVQAYIWSLQQGDLEEITREEMREWILKEQADHAKQVEGFQFFTEEQLEWILDAVYNT